MKSFVKDLEEKEKIEKEQNKLKKKHNIEEENVIVVEKKDTVKFLINLSIRVLKTVIAIILFVLASIGLTCIIYKDPRTEFINIVNEIIGTVNEYTNGFFYKVIK